MITIEEKRVSRDGSTKYLLQVDDSNDHFEAIAFQTDSASSNKYSICISTQVGCKMNCAFCATARIGYVRNLTAEHMLESVNKIVADMKISLNELYYIALMGMGEPLDNYLEIIKFLDLAHQNGFHRISLSSVGIPSKILSLAKVENPPTLFISLHFTQDEVRQRYMPAVKNYPIRDLNAACEKYYDETFVKTKEKIRLSYLLLKGKNDSVEDAERLASLFSPQIYKINLLSYNANQFSDFLAADDDIVEKIKRALQLKGFNVTYRPSKGVDIDGGCGQFVGRKINLN